MIEHNWLLYIAAFACAFAITLVTTPFAKWLSVKCGAIDYPKDRGVHKKPMPRMGGVAIVLGFIITVLMVYHFDKSMNIKQFVGFIIGALMIAGLGVWDDMKNLPAKLKFCVQIVAALIPVLLRSEFRSCFPDTKCLFTIHNIEYQGKYSFETLTDVLDLGPEHYALMRYDDCINLMKAAIVCADKVSTVSPRYSEEIMSPEYSHGLYHCLRDNGGKLSGILNGIDVDNYNPETDDCIEKKFGVADVKKGKKANKKN